MYKSFKNIHYFADDLPVAIQFVFNISSINVFVVPKRIGILYTFENQFNVQRQVTFPIVLPNSTSCLTFFHCIGPTLNTEMTTFKIGMEFCNVSTNIVI